MEIEVVEKEVYIGPDPVQSAPGSIAAGIQSGVDLAHLAALQDAQEQFGLHQRLSTGNGHPAARLVVESHIALDLGQDLGNGHLPANDLPRFGVADLDTGAAQVAKFRIGDDQITVQGYRTLAAGLDTGPTADAAALVEQALAPQCLALGIVTPLAAQRTALQKDSCADPRPVVDGESLDVKDDSADQRRCLSHGWYRPARARLAGAVARRCSL